ncbi:MAD2 mitotic arrest deficient-like 2 [Lobosporangium transversale]|nr:MAD2 mitotic arrest deficient-like 2 [Lobosporangium transversale]
MNEHGARVVLSDVICEFLEVAIHLILFVRGIYPPELFESTQKYGCPIRTARHPGLTSYIQQIIRSIKAELQKGTIHRICIVTLDSTGQALDRFVFEMSMLQAFEGKVLSSALAQLDQDQDVAMNNVAAPNSKNSRVASMDEKGKSKATDYQNDDQANYHADIDDPEMGEEGDDEEEDGEEALLLRRALAHGKYRRQRQQQHQQQQQQQQPYRPQEHGEVRFESLITFTTNVEALLRAILLKISICDSYLKPVVEARVSLDPNLRFCPWGTFETLNDTWKILSSTQDHTRQNH